MNASLKAVQIQYADHGVRSEKRHWLRPMLTLLLLTVPAALACYLLLDTGGALSRLDVLLAGMSTVIVLGTLKLTAYNPDSPIYANEAEDLCRIQQGQQAFGQSALRFRLHAVPSAGGHLSHLEHKPWRHEAAQEQGARYAAGR